MNVLEGISEHLLLVITMRTEEAAIHGGVLLSEALGKCVHLLALGLLRLCQANQKQNYS
jgi:hypothetical protein